MRAPAGLVPSFVWDEKTRAMRPLSPAEAAHASAIPERRFNDTSVYATQRAAGVQANIAMHEGVSGSLRPTAHPVIADDRDDPATIRAAQEKSRRFWEGQGWVCNERGEPIRRTTP
jgi:hypothetical protein